MKFLIDQYLLKNTKDLSFIHIKENAELKIPNYQLPDGGLEIPIFTEELANNIKTRDENKIITVGGIIRGIIYILGIDSNFKYNEEYIKFLYAANPEIEKYILSEAIKALEKNEQLKAVIYSKALVLLNSTDSKILLNYVLTLLQYRDQELLQKKKSYDVYTEEIKDKLEILINIDEDQSLAYYYLGFIYKDKKQYNKAKIHWEKALALNIEENLKEQLNDLLRQLEDMVQYEKGYEAILAERPQEGLSILEELEKKYTEWWNLKFFIGLGYRQLGAFHDAVQQFNKVLAIKKDQVDALAELGLCYAGLGEPQKAIEIYHQVIKLQGNNNEILCNLSMLYLQIGDIEKAKSYLNTSLEIDPNDEIALACKRKLDSVVQGRDLA